MTKLIRKTANKWIDIAVPNDVLQSKDGEHPLIKVGDTEIAIVHSALAYLPVATTARNRADVAIGAQGTNNATLIQYAGGVGEAVGTLRNILQPFRGVDIDAIMIGSEALGGNTDLHISVLYSVYHTSQ